MKNSLIFIFCLCFSTAFAQRARNWNDLPRNVQYYYRTICEQCWGGLQPDLKDGKWGFRDAQGHIVLAYQYDSLKRINYYSSRERTRHIIAQKQGCWGMIDTSGKELLPFEFDDIDFFFGGVPNGSPFINKVNKDGKWGLMNDLGALLAPCRYDSIAYGPDDGYWTKVKLDGKYGYVNYISGKELVPPKYNRLQREYRWLKATSEQGTGILLLNEHVVIPLIYQEIGRFWESGKYAYAKLHDKWGVVDSLNHVYFPIRYDEIVIQSLGKGANALVRLNGKWGIVNTTGAELIPIKYDWLYNRENMYYRVAMLDKKYGIVDTAGREVVPVKYDDLYRNGYDGNFITIPPPTCVKLNGKWAYMDKNGHEATPFKYDEIQSVFARSVPVRMDRWWAFIDRTGKEITPFKYYDVKWAEIVFTAIDSSTNKYGIIDTMGKEVTPFKYDEIVPLFYVGPGRSFAVRKDSAWGFVDVNGRPLTPVKYVFDEIWNFVDGLAAVRKENRWGYINKEGKIVIPIKYDEVTGYFENGRTGVRIGDNWGVINKAGKLLEPFTSDYDLVANPEGID